METRDTYLSSTMTTAQHILRRHNWTSAPPLRHGIMDAPIHSTLGTSQSCSDKEQGGGLMHRGIYRQGEERRSGRKTTGRCYMYPKMDSKKRSSYDTSLYYQCLCTAVPTATITDCPHGRHCCCCRGHSCLRRFVITHVASPRGHSRGRVATSSLLQS